MVKAHLVPKSRLKKEIRIETNCAHHPYSCPYGNACADCGMAEIQAAIWDRRVWRWMCGGISKIGGHHGKYNAKQIRLEEVPEDLIEFLREYDLEWMADVYLKERTR